MNKTETVISRIKSDHSSKEERMIKVSENGMWIAFVDENGKYACMFLTPIQLNKALIEIEILRMEAQK